jgi:hypothetical protein
MTAFFIPAVTESDSVASAEKVYGTMRKEVELSMGRAPRTRRIRELWTRRGNLDCFTTVGQPDPVDGHLVMAIFDMGPHQPFLVYHHRDAPSPALTCAVLGHSAYAVSEFDA